MRAILFCKSRMCLRTRQTRFLQRVTSSNPSTVIPSQFSQGHEDALTQAVSNSCPIPNNDPSLPGAEGKTNAIGMKGHTTFEPVPRFRYADKDLRPSYPGRVISAEDDPSLGGVSQQKYPKRMWRNNSIKRILEDAIKFDSVKASVPAARPIRVWKLDCNAEEFDYISTVKLKEAAKLRKVEQEEMAKAITYLPWMTWSLTGPELSQHSDKEIEAEIDQFQHKDEVSMNGSVENLLVGASHSEQPPALIDEVCQPRPKQERSPKANTTPKSKVKAPTGSMKEVIKATISMPASAEETASGCYSSEEGHGLYSPEHQESGCHIPYNIEELTTMGEELPGPWWMKQGQHHSKFIHAIGKSPKTATSENPATPKHRHAADLPASMPTTTSFRKQSEQLAPKEPKSPHDLGIDRISESIATPSSAGLQLQRELEESVRNLSPPRSLQNAGSLYHTANESTPKANLRKTRSVQLCTPEPTGRNQATLGDPLASPSSQGQPAEPDFDDFLEQAIREVNQQLGLPTLEPGASPSWAPTYPLLEVPSTPPGFNLPAFLPVTPIPSSIDPSPLASDFGASPNSTPTARLTSALPETLFQPSSEATSTDEITTPTPQRRYQKPSVSNKKSRPSTARPVGRPRKPAVKRGVTQVFSTPNKNNPKSEAETEKVDEEARGPPPRKRAKRRTGEFNDAESKGITEIEIVKGVKEFELLMLETPSKIDPNAGPGKIDPDASPNKHDKGNEGQPPRKRAKRQSHEIGSDRKNPPPTPTKSGAKAQTKRGGKLDEVSPPPTARVKKHRADVGGPIVDVLGD